MTDVSDGQLKCIEHVNALNKGREKIIVIAVICSKCVQRHVVRLVAVPMYYFMALGRRLPSVLSLKNVVEVVF